MFGNKSVRHMFDKWWAGQMFGNIRKENIFGNKWAGHMFKETKEPGRCLVI